MRRRLLAMLAMLAMAAAAAAGCGLKGPLTLPEKSSGVVVRDRQTGAGPSTEPAATESAPPKRPPPELPRSENATGRGG